MIRFPYSATLFLLIFLLLITGCSNQEETNGVKATLPPEGALTTNSEKTLAAQNNIDRKMAGQVTEKLAFYLDGYHAMLQSYPQSLEELDNSKYFFNSTDMAEVVPEAYEAVVVLGSKVGNYQIMVIGKDDTAGLFYQGPAGKQSLSPVTRQEISDRVGSFRELGRRKSTVFYHAEG